MRYIDIGGQVIPKHCKYGPRPAEGLVFNPYEWLSITDHLVKDQREKEMVAVMRAKEEMKKQLSFSMTKNWNNTLASIKTQGDQRRLEKREKDKQDKIDKYNEILKNRKEEKKKIISDIRKVLYEDRDPIRLINSGIWAATVLQGQEQQIEKKKMLEKEEAEKEMELEEKLKKEAEEFKRNQVDPEEIEKMKLKRLKEDLAIQIEDVRRRRKAEEEEAEQKKQDLINIRIEEGKIEHCNQVEKNYRKEYAARFCRKSENQLEYERKLILEEEEEEGLNRIHFEYWSRFENERIEREEKALREKVEQRVKVAEKLGEALKEAARREEERLEASVAEKEKEAMKEQESKESFKKQQKDEIIEFKKKMDEKKARERADIKERKKWEVLQIYRGIEVAEELKKSQLQREKEIRDANRKYNEELAKEKKEREAKDLAEWLAPLEDEALEKEELLKYIDQALEFTKEYNLPPGPVLEAIETVKKQNGLWEGPAKGKTEDSGGTGNCPKKVKQERMRNGCYCLKY